VKLQTQLLRLKQAIEESRIRCNALPDSKARRRLVGVVRGLELALAIFEGPNVEKDRAILQGDES